MSVAAVFDRRFFLLNCLCFVMLLALTLHAFAQTNSKTPLKTTPLNIAWKTFSVAKGGLASNDVLTPIARNDAKDLFVVTMGGLSISHDGGKSWQNYYLNHGLLSSMITAIFVSSNGKRVYVATPKGLSISQDGGKSWTNQAILKDLKHPFIQTIQASANGRMILLKILNYKKAQKEGRYTTALSSNWGKSWKLFPKTLCAAAIFSKRGLFSYLSMVNIANFDDSFLYISRSFGFVWHKYTAKQGLVSNKVFSLYASPHYRKIFAINDQGLSVSRNFGFSWHAYTANDGLSGNVIGNIYFGKHDRNIFASTYKDSTSPRVASGISVSLDSGRHWKAITTETGLPSNDVKVVYASDDGKLIEALTKDKFIVSHDGGKSWQTELTLNPNFRSFVTKDGKNIYLGSKKDGLYISHNAGKTFTKVSVNPDYSLDKSGLPSPLLESVIGSQNGQRIYVTLGHYDPHYAGVDIGATYFSISFDGGKTWMNRYRRDFGIRSSDAYAYRPTSFLASFGDANNIFLKGFKGLRISNDAGKTWHYVTTYVDTKAPQKGLIDNHLFKPIYISPDQKTIYVASFNNGISITHGAGKTWQNIPLKELVNGNTASSLIHASTSIDGKSIYIMRSNSFACSHDAGKHWFFFHIPEEKPTYNRLVSFKVRDDGKDIFILKNQGLYISHNGGQDFEPVNIANGCAALDVSQDGKTIYYLSRDGSGGILISYNGGKSWTNRIPLEQSQKSLKTNLFVVSALWAIHASHDGQRIYAIFWGNFFISIDGGKHWEKVLALGPNGGKCWKFENNDRDIYLGTNDQGIYVSHDYGQTWKEHITPEQNGLLGDSVNDLWIDPKGQKMVASINYDTNSVTGGISVSLDGGKSWQNAIGGEDGLGEASYPYNRIAVENNTLYVATSSGLSVGTL